VGLTVCTSCYYFRILIFALTLNTGSHQFWDCKKWFNALNYRLVQLLKPQFVYPLKHFNHQPICVSYSAISFKTRIGSLLGCVVPLLVYAMCDGKALERMWLIQKYISIQKLIQVYSTTSHIMVVWWYSIGRIPVEITVNPTFISSTTYSVKA
jgi:hypothetical protein